MASLRFVAALKSVSEEKKKSEPIIDGLYSVFLGFICAGVPCA